jgi:hypothetical protein
MKFSSSRRIALGVGLILATAHCNGDDNETMADASVDAHVADAVVSDNNADARDAGGSGGSDGGNSSPDDGSGGSDGAAASVDGGSRVDGAAVDASDAEASSSAVDTGADVPRIPVDAGADTGEVLDALADVPLIPDDAGPTFAHVKQIFALRCGACHGEAMAAKHIDLVTPTGLRERLVGPLAVAQGFCGVDGGADGGGAPLHAIVPGNTTESYLYQKIVAGPPVTCGMRMPRMGSAGCDKVDGGNICLSQGDTDTIKQWIETNAPE